MKEWDSVAFGKEVTWKDYAQWTAAAVADAFGCSGTCTTTIITSVLTSIGKEAVQQVQALGIQTLFNLITSGDILELDSVTIKGGILSYDCWIDDCKCCTWGCGQFVPCSGCSCKRCGTIHRDAPNIQQPYIATRNKNTNTEKVSDISCIKVVHSGIKNGKGPSPGVPMVAGEQEDQCRRSLGTDCIIGRTYAILLPEGNVVFVNCNDCSSRPENGLLGCRSYGAYDNQVPKENLDCMCYT